MRIQNNSSLNILSYTQEEQFIKISEVGTDLFDELNLEFLFELSKSILNDPELKKHPELVSFAFYCRRANLIKLKNKFTHSGEFRFGRGIVFHITPGNVPLNFAYSLLSAMLSGNSSIVRVPSRQFVEVDILISRINQLLMQARYQELTKRMIIVRYEATSEWTSFFSKNCDVRIIWGGNNTINNIRRNPIKPSANEITFYDRFSVSVISANSVVVSQGLSQLASNFFIDTLFYDQNACTSSKQIFWLGDTETISKAKRVFWKQFELELLKRNYTFPVNSSVSKICTLMEKVATREIMEHPMDLSANLPLTRISVSKKVDFKENDFIKAGLFIETSVNNLSEINQFLGSNCQTLSYYGVDKKDLEGYITRELPQIDRIVPIGHTMDFSFNWDGYNLIQTMSRIVELN
jgi:hypothetical protein